MTAIAIATFEGIAGWQAAQRRAVAEDHRIIGAWAPYATEPEPPARDPILAWVAIGGIAGALLFYALEWWSAVHAYRFDVGARPLHSPLAFLIAPIEVAALCAAVAGVVRMMIAAGLTRLHHAAFDLDEVGDSSRDAFVLALACDEGADANAALALLAEAGAVHSRLVTA